MTDIRAISLCSLAMVVTPQYVGDASGSVLFPDRLLHKLHGRGLAKSTICWIPLSLSFSPFLQSFFPLFSLVCQFFFSFITNTDQKTHSFSDCLHNKSFLLVRIQSLVKASRQVFFFCLFVSLQSICYQRSLGIPQSLVRGPAFLPLVE